MTASLHRLGAGAEAGLYYTNDSEREARPDRRDEYYLADGGGVWGSSGDSVAPAPTNAVPPSQRRARPRLIPPRRSSASARRTGISPAIRIPLSVHPAKLLSFG